MSKTPLPIDFEKEFAPLGAKTAMKEVGAKSGDRWAVPVEYLHVMPGFNIRITDAPDYEAGIESLKESIKANGFYPHKPLAAVILAEDGGTFIYVTDGHRRLEAALRAKKEGAEIETLPVVVQPAGTSLEEMTVQLATTALEARTLSPMELALVVHRLAKFGWDDKKIAERLGKTPKYIGDLQVLLGSPQAVRNLVVAGKVSASQAIQTVKEHGPEASKVLKEGVAAAEAAGKAKATGKHIEKKPREPRQPAEPKGKVPGTADFLLGAMNYAIDVVQPEKGDGLEWLRAWREGDLEIMAELETYMGQPEGSTNDATKRVPVQPKAPEPKPQAEPEEPSDI